MLQSTGWLKTSGAQFLPEPGQSGLLHLRDYSAEYCSWGDGPPLVLVPGIAGGMELLGPLVKLLSKHYRVISYQLRGETDCFLHRQPYGLSELVGDLDQVLDALCLETPTVFGVSFGGLIALELASRHPHRIQNLIVHGVGSKFEPGLLQRVAKAVLTRFPLPTDSPFINQFFNLLFGCAQKRDPLFQFVVERCWRTDQSVMAHRLKMVEEFDLESRLGRIRVPTLILAGDRDVLVSKRSLKQLSEGVDKAEYVPLPGCGHLAFVTHPGLISRELNRFFRESAGELVA